MNKRRRRWPEESIGPHDEREVNIGVAAWPEKGLVVLLFEDQQKQMAVSPAIARALAGMLLAKADMVDGGTQKGEAHISGPSPAEAEAVFRNIPDTQDKANLMLSLAEDGSLVVQLSKPMTHLDFAPEQAQILLASLQQLLGGR